MPKHQWQSLLFCLHHAPFSLLDNVLQSALGWSHCPSEGCCVPSGCQQQRPWHIKSNLLLAQKHIPKLHGSHNNGQKPIVCAFPEIHLLRINDPNTGLGNITLWDPFCYLFNNYGHISPSQVIKHIDGLMMSYVPTMPLAMLFNLLFQAPLFATTRNNPFPENNLVVHAILLLICCGPTPLFYKHCMSYLRPRKCKTIQWHTSSPQKWALSKNNLDPILEMLLIVSIMPKCNEALNNSTKQRMHSSWNKMNCSRLKSTNSKQMTTSSKFNFHICIYRFKSMHKPISK